MVNSIEDVLELHKQEGNIEDAHVKIFLDERVLDLNIYSMKISAESATKEDVEIWTERLWHEIKKDNALEKEIKEFASVFDLLNRFRVRTGVIRKSEKPDFIIEKNGKTIRD